MGRGREPGASSTTPELASGPLLPSSPFPPRPRPAGSPCPGRPPARQPLPPAALRVPMILSNRVRSAASLSPAPRMVPQRSRSSHACSASVISARTRAPTASALRRAHQASRRGPKTSASFTSNWKHNPQGRQWRRAGKMSARGDKEELTRRHESGFHHGPQFYPQCPLPPRPAPY